MSDSDSDIISNVSSSSSESAESSSDEDFGFLYERERPKNENFFEETVPQYREEFLEHFKINRHSAEALADQFENSELLKQKFRQLYHVKLRSITDTVHLIRACCVLHNLALQDEFHLQDPGEGNVELPLQLKVIEHDGDKRDDRTGQQCRNEVVQMLPY
ncbi:hypothetical protein ILUMI_18503 [Ignelater luminosus]|uniref:DDE Tnp4 domain-containing protein n=1 Tax=Ignelater luminosus TaxID=2038154 RepID=A0A8K0G6H6_IGNLU|nr:hypothetical protein ILUMI_18503 [Ignelater luminosus]